MSLFSDNITNKVPQEVLADFLKNWIDSNFVNLWNLRRGNLEEVEKEFNSTLRLTQSRETCAKYNVHHPWIVLQPVVDESMIGKVLITVMYFSTSIHSISRSILLQYKVPFPISKF